MEKTWTDYVHIHSNLPGARDAFEQDCKRLLTVMHPAQPVHVVRANPGDGGIDVFVGEFSAEPLTVYQCKFFLDALGDSQKQQIRESFQRIGEATDFTVAEWVLCVPLADFTLAEHAWWSKWKVEQQRVTGITIRLLNGHDLLTLLKQHDLYDLVFNQQDSLRLAHIQAQMTELLTRVPASEVSETSGLTGELVLDQQQFQVLFTPEYTPAYEAFYVARQPDQQLLDLLRSPKNIWLYGASGLGKTCLATRTMQQQRVPHIYCYLTALPNPRDAASALLLIAEDVAEQYPGRLAGFHYASSSPVKQLAHLLAHLFPTESFTVCIDEVHIPDPVVFGDFVNAIAAVCAEYRNCRSNASNLRFLIATIQPPAAFLHNTAKFRELFTSLELTSWLKTDLNCLLQQMNGIGQLLTAEEMRAVQQACSSPRTVKEIAHQYVLNHRHQTLEQVINYVIANN